MGGGEARQTAKLASGNLPYHGHHAQFMNGGWLGGGSCQVFVFFFFFSQKLESSLGWEFKVLFGLQICCWVVRKIVYSLFSILIIIIIIASTSISISFVALLDCLRVSPFVHFSFPSRQGGRRGVSKLLPSA